MGKKILNVIIIIALCIFLYRFIITHQTPPTTTVQTGDEKYCPYCGKIVSSTVHTITIPVGDQGKIQDSENSPGLR